MRCCRGGLGIHVSSVLAGILTAASPPIPYLAIASACTEVRYHLLASGKISRVDLLRTSVSSSSYGIHEGSDYPDFRSVQEPGIPYFTPKQSTPVGAALPHEDESSENAISAVFRPLTIRGVNFCNRIFVSPMCMYSCSGDGMMTDFHLVNAGQFALRGAALVTLEATAVLPSGLNSVQDAGLWSDEHIAPVKRVVDFIHSQSKHAAIQLQHAGRKASICPPWLGLRTVPEQFGGFPDVVLAPTAESWNDNYALPKEMTEKEIWEVVEAFGQASKRAVKAGCRIVAVHGAHGYLIHSFASPASNKRTDQWGGSFENRIKFAVEIVRAIRRNVPPETLLFWKISAVDWLPLGEGWELEDTLRFAPILAAEGVDMLDVSSGGTDRRQKVEMGPQYQVKFAKAVKDLSIPGLYVGAVGWIRDGATVADIIESRKADFCSVAREFLRDPNFVQRVAMEVGTKIAWPDQYHRASYEGSYVESTTSISTDAKAHVHITRDNTLDQGKPPSAVDTSEPADAKTDS